MGRVLHNRRARPTLRMLREDLTAGWDSPFPLRWLSEDAYGELHPLSELPHPIVAKSAEWFGSDPAEDIVVGRIESSTHLRLSEVKCAQWRGAVWEDPASGVRWLVAAGLAKGEHEDHDDFYEKIRRQDHSGTTMQWLPTAQDIRLLNQETSAWLRTAWELQVQGQILEALRDARCGGSCRIAIAHPVAEQGEFARIDLSITPVREDDYEADEIELEIVPTSSRYAGSDLLWQLITRVLISINPPEQGWDRYKDTYSNIGEPGAWTARVAELGVLVERDELAVSEPGSTSHYAHRRHLADSTIDGTAVRSLCGVFFVPTRDHESLPHCPSCEELLAELPR